MIVRVCDGFNPLLSSLMLFGQHCTPLAFLRGTGVNDELDGSESKSAVRFTVPNQDIPRGIQPEDVPKDLSEKYKMECEIVQSLAKWKRIMLDRLDIPVGEGVYCDSTSIRKGYKGDVTHSVVADQWDFEIHISKEQRTVDALKNYVTAIYKIITDAQDMILEKYPEIAGPPGHPTEMWRLPKEIHFTTADELHKEFPYMDAHERETAAVRKYGVIFILGMGWPLEDGSPAEEVRSPGYDDWNLNGDIIAYHPLTEYRHELSSMGIRVDKDALLKQLEHRGVEHEADLDFQKAVIEERLPFSYGGGIGISRLMMLLLRTCHIGEVQVGLWHDEHYKQAIEAGIDMIPDRLLTLDKKEGGGLAP